MDKQQVFELMQEMGYDVSYDDDGDIQFLYQLKRLFFILSPDDDDFASLLLPQFYNIDDDEENIVLAACNKMTRDLKLSKVFVDYTFKNVTAACEFYFTDEDSLRLNITHALHILGLISSRFYRTVQELRDCLDSDN